MLPTVHSIYDGFVLADALSVSLHDTEQKLLLVFVSHRLLTASNKGNTSLCAVVNDLRGMLSSLSESGFVGNLRDDVFVGLGFTHSETTQTD